MLEAEVRNGICRYYNLIDGERRPARSGAWLPSVNPATGQVWAEIPLGEAADIDDAVQAAKRAFKSWRRLPALQRAALLRKLGDLVMENVAALAEVETRDNGKPFAEELAGDVPAVAQMFYYWAGAADKIHGETVEIGPGSFNYVRHEPVGVVGLVLPWNSPLALFTAKVGAALAAGNTVVVKPPEMASCSMLTIAGLFAKAGFPPGVLNVVAGLGTTAGDAVAAHPDIGKISFTGSTATARAITRRSADAIKPLAFELGGKSANIIFPDADLAAAAVGATTMSVFTGGAGQTCVAGSRVLIHESIYDEMLDRMIAIAKTIKLGDPMDKATAMGPLAFDGQFAKVTSYLELGRREGAEIAYGGGHGAALFESGSPLAHGYYVQPTLFVGARNDMRICREEIFGPVAAVLPFRDEEEAVAIANDSTYGLACGLWTNDLKRAHRVAAEVDVGAVWINAYRRIHWAVPFGGVKDSGYGRDSGLESLRGYQRSKSVWVDLA